MMVVETAVGTRSHPTVLAEEIQFLIWRNNHALTSRTLEQERMESIC